MKSGRSGASASARAVEIASEPNSSTTSSPAPVAMAAANSLTRCCGDWLPTTSSTARAGFALRRAATERG
nr:hypothetical protein [Candidatus Frankia alpina]